MPPPFIRRASLNRKIPSVEFASQWKQPRDVFTVLLLVGGDVVARALGQLSGGVFTPVTFSFGWVAYIVSALVSTIGENKLMPAADTPSIVINAESGYVRNNQSWILGRVVRDFDRWRDPEIEQLARRLVVKKQAELHEKMKEKNIMEREPVEVISQAGLVISVYKVAEHKKPGEPDMDWVYMSGIVVGILQFAVAAIPCGLYRDWSILMVTAVGTLLALATGALGQWGCEKWACRRDGKTFILTRGNGSQHALLILGARRGLNLEDLASAQLTVDQTIGFRTRTAVGVLALLWVALLITAAGLEENTWFLLAVGGMGILHNVCVAGCWRRPSAYGLHLDFLEVIGERKVMEALYSIEEAHPGVGLSMRETFFPGNLRSDEVSRWEDSKRSLKERKKEKQGLVGGVGVERKHAFVQPVVKSVKT